MAISLVARRLPSVAASSARFASTQASPLLTSAAFRSAAANVTRSDVQSALKSAKAYSTGNKVATAQLAKVETVFNSPSATKANQKALAELLKGAPSNSVTGSKLSKMVSALPGMGMVHCDAPEPWQYGFQDSASVTMEGITELHNAVMYFVIAIIVGVTYAMGAILYRFRRSQNPIASKYLNHGTLIELIWTITPAFVLIAVAFPSFRLLYLMDEVISPALTLKVMGHQWYWSYEYCDFVNSGDDEDEE